MPGSDGGSGESDVMYICLRRTKIFSCEVPKQQGSLTRLEWRIDFQHSSRPSEASVTRQFTSADPEGYTFWERADQESGLRSILITFNGSLSLVSVMNLTIDDINATALINNATVNCGDEANRKMIQVVEGD